MLVGLEYMLSDILELHLVFCTNSLTCDREGSRSISETEREVRTLREFLRLENEMNYRLAPAKFLYLLPACSDG